MTTSITNKLTSYLAFQLGEEVFATNVRSVLSILKMPRITKIPCTPAYFIGVVNLRGEVLPVINTRIRFGMEAAAVTANTCILVMELNVENQVVKLGMLVDSVSEVYEIGEDDIQPFPSVGNKFRSEFIEGMYKTGEAFIMIISMDKVISLDELKVLTEGLEEGIQEIN